MKVPPPTTDCHGWRNGPWAFFGKNLPGVHRPRNLGCCRAGVQGTIWGALSVLPCRCQDQFMAKLHEELGQHLVWAGLCGAMGTAQSMSRWQGCSWAHSSFLARSPSADSRREEVAKRWLPDEEVWPCNWCSRSTAQQHQNQSPGHQQPSEAPQWCSIMGPCRCTLPSPSPHAHTAQTSDCTALQASFISSPSSRNPGGGQLTGHGQTMLQCMPQDTPIPCQDQPQSVHPRAPQGNRSFSTLLMTWVTHCHYLLTWPVS